MSKFSNYNFSGQKALIRVDFNVPLDKQTLAITDDNRMKATIPTIKKILSDGGAVILMSHLGRPKDGPEDKSSLKHLVKHLSELLGGTTILFVNDCTGEEAAMQRISYRLVKCCYWKTFVFIRKKKKAMSSSQKN